MKINYIIPTYGLQGNRLTHACIKTLRKFMGAIDNIIIVIDGYTKEIYDDLVQRLKDFENFKIIHSDENQGFAKTVNFGLHESNSEIKILLNNDVLFFEDIRHHVIETFESDPEIGIVGAQLLYPNGTIQHGGLKRTRKHIFYHVDEKKPLEQGYEAQVSKYIIGVTGAFFCISEKCHEAIGSLSEIFFNGFENTHYCLQAWSNNFKVYYNPKIIALHLEGITRGNNSKSKQAINKNWYDKEKKSEKLFIDYFNNDIDIYDIEKKVDASNDSAKEQWPKYYNSKRIVLGLKRSGAIGDCVLLTGIIEYLSNTYPGIDINVLTGCPEVFKNNNNINIVTNNDKEFYCDVLIDFDLAYEKYPGLNILSSYSRKIFGKDLSLVNSLGPKLYPDKNNIQFAKSLYDNSNNKTFVIHMATSWPSRTLDLKKWSLIAKYILDKGLRVVIVGNKNDQFPYKLPLLDLRGKTSILDCQQIIAEADCFICTDSSLFHVASSTKTPIIGIFSCVNPLTRISRPENTYSVFPSASVCRFKLSKEKNVVTNHKCTNKRKHACIKSINISDVFVFIDNILEQKNDTHTLPLPK